MSHWRIYCYSAFIAKVQNFQPFVKLMPVNALDDDQSETFSWGHFKIACYHTDRWLTPVTLWSNYIIIIIYLFIQDTAPNLCLVDSPVAVPPTQPCRLQGRYHGTLLPCRG